MKIVCVHGIGQTYRGAASLSLHWKAALRDGVIEAGGADVSESDIAMVAYGALFRQNTRSVGARVDPESLDEAEQTLLQAYWQEAAALSAASDGTEPQESPAIQPPEFEGRARMPQLMQRALRQLSKSKYFKAIGGPSAALAFVRQVRLFLHDREFKADILERFAAQMSSQTRVLIGHSLGSVVAYEGLCAHPEWKVDAFITLGSPLGISNVVFDALTPKPVNGRGQWPGVRRWTNIADAGDIVALRKELAPLFGPVEDRIVYNGWHSHDVTRYLSARETGSAIAAALASHGQI